MAYLILVRHGKSAWNHLGLWTGHTDVELVEEGRAEARRAGEFIRDMQIHKAHVSALMRAQQTLEEIKHTLNRHDLPIHIHSALNERHYGIHTGKNKWQVKEEMGEQAFNDLRRGWDVPIESGETLKDVHERVVPYYREHIHDDLVAGNNILIVAHGNTLRALIKHLENLNDDAIADVEIATGEVHCYQLDESGTVIKKEIRTTES